MNGKQLARMPYRIVPQKKDDFLNSAGPQAGISALEGEIDHAQRVAPHQLLVDQRRSHICHREEIGRKAANL
jgi:hypothetical protein